MTDSERPVWRDRADEIERQVGMGKMGAMACYTQMVQLLDAERRAPAAPVPQGWKLVPVEPPQEALYAIGRLVDDPRAFEDSESFWDYLLAAAPKP